MSEATEYVANALLRFARPREVFIEKYFYQTEPLANRFTVQIHPGQILPDWIHDDEIKALLDRGLIAPRDGTAS